jgi:hypothetical protein
MFSFAKIPHFYDSSDERFVMRGESEISQRIEPKMTGPQMHRGRGRNHPRRRALPPKTIRSFRPH